MTPAPPFIRTLERLRLTFWRRRVGRGLVRAAWLALLPPILALVFWLWGGQPVPVYGWLTASGGLAGAALLWAMRPIGLEKMTRRLDELLHARAQLITAYEVSQLPPAAANPVANQLLQQAVDLAIGARRRLAGVGRGFWLELHALLALPAILAALLLLDALSPPLPRPAPLELPPAGQEPGAEALPPLEAQLQPPPFQPPPLSPAQVQAALEALAEALRDQAVSNPVAAALDRGDLAGAAEAVRGIADRLPQLSPGAKAELGQALTEAARNMGETPGFSAPLQAGGAALADDDPGPAGAALDQVAQTLDRLAESRPQTEAAPQPDPLDESASGAPAPGGAEAGESERGGGEPSPEEAGRLPQAGEPVELPADSDLAGRVLQPAPLETTPGDRRTTEAPFARRPLAPPVDELGADPLSYPWDKREIVRRYFTP
jgi:hypothetical protein